MALRTSKPLHRVRTHPVRSEGHSRETPDPGKDWGVFLSRVKVKLLLLGPIGVGLWFLLKLLACYFLGICVL